VRQVGRKYLYNIIVFITACIAGLGSGGPEVKPSTPRPLPARLRELAGKSRWMNWEPNLAGGGCQVRGGGHKSCECAREKERGGGSNRKLRHNASSYFINGNLRSLIY